MGSTKETSGAEPTMDVARMTRRREALSRMLRNQARVSGTTGYVIRRAMQRGANLPNQANLDGLLNGTMDYRITTFMSVLDRLGITARFFLPNGEEVTPRLP